MTANDITPAATNPCGTGGGTIKAGFERAVYVGAAAAEALAAEFGTPATALILAPVIAGGTYDLLHICTNGDPGDPGLTVQDLVYALTPGDFVNSGNAWQRIQQWFVHMMWPTWCDCANGTIPPPSTTAPLPTSSTNPGLPAATSGTSCWYNGQSAVSVPGQGFNFNMSTWYWDDGASHTAGNERHAAPPGGVYGNRLHMHYTPGPSDVVTAVFGQISYYNAAGSQIGLVQGPPGPTTAMDFTLNATAPAGTASIQVIPNVATSSGGNPTGSYYAENWMYCTGQSPGTPATPCCPPDPLIDQKLNAIIQMLQQLAIGSAPSDTYVNGPVHSGLSGNANFTLSKGTIAMQVHVTSDISHFFQGSPNPQYYFSLGFVTPVAVGAPLRGSRLIYGRQIYPLEPEVDQVYLALAPGVVIDVTELKAGVR